MQGITYVSVLWCQPDCGDEAGLLIVFEVLGCVGKAFCFKLCNQVSFYGLNDIVSAIAILLWICRVSATASSHDVSPFN